MKRLLVISPHLDDAVFACGGLLAKHPGSTVVTVFAGVPQNSHGLTEWDATCGFLSAREAVRMRRREDETALALVHAKALWLDFADAQYRETPPGADVTRALRSVLEQTPCDTVLFPLGLYHSDHVLVHHATLALVRDGWPLDWWCYEDTFYRRIPRLVDQRVARLEHSFKVLSALENAGGLAAAKRPAVYCYASQLRGLASAGRPGHLDALSPERYWPLAVEQEALHG